MKKNIIIVIFIIAFLTLFGCEKEVNNPKYIAIKTTLKTPSLNYHWDIKKKYLDQSISHNWIKETYKNNKVPYIELHQIKNISTEAFLNEFLDHIYDEELNQLVRAAKQTNYPVIVNFLPLTQYPSISASQYKETYDYIIKYCNHKGAGNIFWVFEGLINDIKKTETYFPGKDKIKWMILNTEDKNLNLNTIQNIVDRENENLPHNFILDKSIISLFKSNKDLTAFLNDHSNIVGIVLDLNNYPNNAKSLSKEHIFNFKYDNLEHLLYRHNIENELFIKQIENQ